MRIVVLAGGLSPERDVSLSSGSLIANALMENGHRVALVDVYTGPGVFIGPEALFYHKESGKVFSYDVPKAEPDLARLKREASRGGAMIGKNVLELCAQADLAFIALHGSIGENGQLQAVLESYGIPFTGTGYTGSLLAMDKDIAKRLMVQGGIATPDWMLFDTASDPIDSAVEQIGAPCVVKPCGCGSSVGVSIIREPKDLQAALTAAKKFERHVLVEKMIEGREFSVGVLDGAPLPVIEIIPGDGFYSYENKYQPGYTKEICPAEIPEAASARLQAAALAVHRTLRLGFYSRIDFIVDGQGRHYCLEANTLPGMTPTSLLPQEAAAAGIGYNELCEKIVRSAFPV